MKDYASNRPYYVRLHLMDRFDLSDTITVDIQNQDPEMGICSNKFNPSRQIV